ncbi:MAG TPA: DNA-formamidopyrimidine glycosylase family protein [Bacillota bacterium]
MPELPEVTIYVERIRALVAGRRLERLRVFNPFLLRTVDPPPEALDGRVLQDAGRIGKRIVLSFEGDLHAVIHLMIAGRLRWRQAGAAPPKRRGLAAFDFEPGTLLLTEEGTKRRAALHLVSGRDGLDRFDRGGVDLLTSTPQALATALRRENRTLKRALTDPTVVDGVGNAWSDEILHRARLSPFKQTAALTDDEIARLHAAGVEVLHEAIQVQRDEVGTGFPEKVTAFHPSMRVHGRYRQPCPVCGAPIQRIVYADNEANYCPGCQTGGRIYADRALSRLLKGDWPRTLEELEDGPLGGGR